ncbi:MAG: ROK family protein [Actinobacteria bacterium]|nr:ROK family protein [Actinomycetota bacterium]
MSEHYIGIEIGGTKLQIVVGDEQCNIVKHYRISVDKEKGAAGIQQEIEATLKNLPNEYNPRAIGVGFGGPVDCETGEIAVSHQISGWSGFQLVSWLGDMTGLPVQVENDANTAALGEAIKGVGKDFSIVFYITLGSGVGGGLVADGKIYHGMKPGEAEIGLMMFDKSGANLESHCSGWAVDAKIRQYIAKNPHTILAQLAGKESKAQARFLVPAMAQGDDGARKILEETADDLAFGLSHVVHLLNPAIIILGGGLSLIGEPLRATVSSLIRKYITKAYLPGPEIEIAALGEDVVCIGALLLAREKGMTGKENNEE